MMYMSLVVVSLYLHLWLNNYSVTEFQMIIPRIVVTHSYENFVKSYVNTNVIQANSYLRNKYFKHQIVYQHHQRQFLDFFFKPKLTSTSKNDFIFFINGQYMEHDL